MKSFFFHVLSSCKENQIQQCSLKEAEKHANRNHKSSWPAKIDHIIMFEVPEQKMLRYTV